MGPEAQHGNTPDLPHERLTREFLDAPLPPISDDARETAELLGKKGDEVQAWWEYVVRGNRQMLAKEWSTNGFQTDLVNAMQTEASAVMRAKEGDIYRKEKLPTFEEYITSRNELERSYLRERTGEKNIKAFEALVAEFNESQQALLEAKDWDGLLNRLRTIFTLITARKPHF